MNNYKLLSTATVMSTEKVQTKKIIQIQTFAKCLANAPVKITTPSRTKSYLSSSGAYKDYGEKTGAQKSSVCIKTMKQRIHHKCYWQTKLSNLFIQVVLKNWKQQRHILSPMLVNDHNARINHPSTNISIRVSLHRIKK